MPNDDPIYCIDCGEEIQLSKFASRERTKRCKTCSDAYWREYRNETAPEYAKTTGPAEPLFKLFSKYTIEIELDPTGDFKPGSKFGVLDVMDSGAKSISPGRPARDCWMPGTMFFDSKTGNHWIVNNQQRIEEVIS